MADIHHHHDTAVVTDADGPSAMLIAVIVLMLVGFLIWLFAFSGIVFDNGNTNPGPTVNRGGDTNVTVPGDTGSDTGTTTDGGTQPSP